MAIIYHQDTQEFHLYNDEMSYILCVLPNRQLGQLYVGKRVNTEKSYRHLIEERYRPLTAYVDTHNDKFSLQHVQQEYASYGTGDMSCAAFEIKQEDGSRLSHFEYVGYRIIEGKPSLDGLPAVYTNASHEATTLEIELYDSCSETRLYLTYTVFERLSVITRNARFVQVGSQSIRLTTAMSLCLDLPDSQYDWIHLDGAWGRERHVQENRLHQGVQSIYSLKGASSAEHNPFMALKRFTADEHQGEVMGFSLVYSGNFLAQVEVTPYQKTRLLMGIHPTGFEWQLGKGEVFQTPEVVMVYSQKGLNGMSQTFHRLYRHHLVRGYWRDKERPILLNNWEAMTFDINETSILTLAQKAAAVGIELFVLDDGWFGERYNDYAGLGDWVVNLKKFPNGLQHTINQIKQLGLKFGLWIEPEMVNKDSDLYRQHPDWILHHPQHRQSPARHQHTLDFSREDVFQYIFKSLFTLLSTHEIDYIKWDMNRYMTEVYSVYHTKQQQGEIFHRYILNVYRLYEKLTKAFPNILFESCASGGARFDPGMLYYSPQVWTSDNTDAIERLKIQYGTSLVYPLNSMGCHVSQVPNQQVNRTTPLNTRAAVAYFGSFGYELDLSNESVEEMEEIRQQVDFYKTYRAVFQKGKFTRLLSPFVQPCVAWQVISEDKSQVIAGYYRTMVSANEGAKRLKLVDLKPNGQYQLDGEVYYGDELMNIGLVIPENCVHPQDFHSNLFVLTTLN